jgi:cyclopropane fatty-acyl-phospholipid synthase-like methyltransferase
VPAPVDLRFTPAREEAELREYLGSDFELGRLQRHREQLQAEFRASHGEEAFYRASAGYLYDLTAFAMSGVKLPYLQELVRRVPPGSQILDFGCGIGSDGLLLLEAGYRVEFAEFDNPSSRYLRWRLHRRGLQAAVHDLDGEVPGGFDAAYSYDVLEHVSDPLALLGELERRARVVEVNLLAGGDDHEPLHHRLPLARLLRHVARHRVHSYRVLHGRSHLVLYDAEPGSWGGRCRSALRLLDAAARYWGARARSAAVHRWPVGRRRRAEAGSVGAPAVPAEVYDTDYFLHRSAGSQSWRSSDGAARDPLYDGSLELARLQPGEAVLDLGTGRGELLVAAVQRGAGRAVGVEYSSAAVALARQTLAHAAVADQAQVIHADARELPVPDASFDLVTLLDVVEHLAEDELAVALREARRALRPGGRIFVHTFPTRTLYEVTYRLQRASRSHRREQWPKDPRNQLERTMHINEQSLRSLRSALRAAGYADVKVSPGAWIYTDFVPDAAARRLYHRLARVPYLRRLAVADLWAEGLRG